MILDQTLLLRLHEQEDNFLTTTLQNEHLAALSFHHKAATMSHRDLQTCSLVKKRQQTQRRVKEEARPSILPSHLPMPKTRASLETLQPLRLSLVVNPHIPERMSKGSLFGNSRTKAILLSLNKSLTRPWKRLCEGYSSSKHLLMRRHLPIRRFLPRSRVRQILVGFLLGLLRLAQSLTLPMASTDIELGSGKGLAAKTGSISPAAFL